MSNGGVRYTLVDTSATNVPIVAASVQNAGMNIPGGAVDEVIVRMAFTLNAAGDILADTSNIIDSFRLILNGETVWDYQASISDNNNNACGNDGSTNSHNNDNDNSIRSRSRSDSRRSNNDTNNSKKQKY